MSNNHIARYPDELPSEAERRTRADQTFWTTLGILYNWRRFIIGVTVGVAVLAVIISLLLPNWYAASTRLILPSQGGVSLLSSAISSSLPSAAQSLLGGVSGDYLRLLSILDSRSVKANVVEHFDLVTVYDTKDSDTPVADAIEILTGNIDFLIDEEYNHLAVVVEDTDPERAAAMANFFVDELSRINAALSSQSAALFRGYVEQRYEETEAQLDSVLTAMQGLQQQYGVLDLPTQGEQFFTTVAELRVVALQAEAQYETLLSQFGPEHSAVRAAQQAARSANRQYEQAMEGQERLLPVPKEQFPTVAREFLDLEQERVILTTILEYTRPVLEEARFDEQRQVEAVQVIDTAVPPVKKSRPKRSVICVAATLSAFILAVLFVLVYTWWQRNHAVYARRLREAAAGNVPPPPAPHSSAPEPPSSKPVTTS